MKVFYVMVLVLGAGAVPSQGRTESEGTIFNKTQSHESMNNVTASNSELETYGYFYLVMQWPRSFCNSRSINQIPCYHQQVPGRFTVHGLWPQSISGRGIDCTNRRIYGHYPLFNSRQFFSARPNLVPGLNTYWLDLTSSENNNECFWGTEYNKHGSCTFNDQNVYFGLTLTLAQNLGDRLSRLSRIGRGRSIIPGNSYLPSVIENAVRVVTSKRPRLRCITVRNSIQLLEIRFCADRNGNRLNLIDCLPYSDCGNGQVHFPRP